MKRSRKLLSVILALALLLAALPTAALAATNTACRGPSPDGKHHYGSWEVVRKGTCTSPALEARSCKYCGGARQERTGKKAAHSYGGWKTTKKATCTSGGTETRTCKVCGKKDTRSTKKTSHSYGSWTTSQKATCTRSGTETRACKVCGRKDTRSTKKTSHSYGGWTTTQAATCTRTGTRTRRCVNCGTAQTETLQKTAHSYSAWTVTKAATCTATGTRTRACRVCGHRDEDTLAKLPHTWSDWEILVEATDHSSGTRARTCAACGERETEDFDPEGTLRRGDRGDAVEELQEALICYGALRAGGADGDYGPGTESAVTQVQQSEGFAEDGVAWPQTQAVLGHRFGEWEVVSELSDFSMGLRQRTCERCGFVEKIEEWPSPMYKRGDRGDGVKALQQALNDQGYNCGWPDGDFGGNTERAVGAIEADHGVEADGIAWPGVLKWLGLHEGGDEGEEDGDDDGDAPEDNADPGNITTFSGPKNPPESAPAAVFPDSSADAEPYVYLTYDPVGVVDIKPGDTLDVMMHVMNSGDIPVNLKHIDVGSDESCSTEAWMSGELEPGKTYDFTYHIHITGDDTKPSSSYREPMVTVIDPVTKKEAYDTAWVIFASKKSGARIAVMPDRSKALKGVMGMKIGVPVSVLNIGDVALENLTFSWLNANKGDRPSDEAGGYSDASLIGHMEPGQVLELTYMIHIVDADVGESAYSASRKFTATANPAGGGAPAKDSFSIGFTVLESNQSKVTVTKKEVSERPREEGYYPGEKITYEVTVKNDGDRTLESVNLYDPLSEDETDWFADISNIAPGHEASRKLTYTVTDSAAETGHVETEATAAIEDGVELWMKQSNAVKTPCAKKPGSGDSGGSDGEDEAFSGVSMWAVPKDSTITSVSEGDDIEFILRLYNSGDVPLTESFIRAYDGQSQEREMYYSDQDPLPALTYYETEDHYVVTKEDAAGDELILYWEAFGKLNGGDWLTDDTSISYDIKPTKPDDGGEYDWKPPTEPEPETAPAVLEPEPVVVGDVTLKLEIMTEMKYPQGYVAGDSIVYNVIAVNNGEGNITEVEFWDSLHGLEAGQQIKKDGFAKGGGGTSTGHTYYTVTKEDVEQGHLEIKGHVKWKGADGEYHEGDTDTAVLPLFGVNLTIEQTVVGGEKTLRYKGDTVVFQLEVKNPSDIDVSTASVYHRLYNTPTLGMGDKLAENVFIPAHGSKTFEAKHVVDDDDVIRGKVTHSGAVSDGLGNGPAHHAYTDGAEVPVSQEGQEDLVKPLDILMEIVGGEDQVFKQGDQFEVKYTVHNPRSVDVASARIEAYFEGTSGSVNVAKDVYIAAHKSVTKTREYTVTGPDAVRGYVRTKGEVLDGLGTTGIHNTVTDWVNLTVEKNEEADAPLVVTKSIKGGDDQVFFLGDEITFEITVENTKDFALDKVEIRDQPAGKSKTYLVADKVTIPAHKSVTKEYKYTVTPEDVVRTYVPNWAFASDGIGSGDGHSFKSNRVQATVGPSGDLQEPITVTKSVKGGETKEYKEGDVIIFEITVANPKSIDLPHVEIVDYPNGTGKGIVLTGSLSVPAHGSNSIEYPYTVTKPDEDRGYVTNQARAWDGMNMLEGKDKYAYTDVIKVNLDGSPAAAGPLTVTKKVAGKPNGYQENEEITYVITVTNNGDKTIDEVEVYDPKKGSEEDMLVDTLHGLQPHVPQTATFTYTVTASDVNDHGYVDNQAFVVWYDADGEHRVDSNLVHVTTAKPDEQPEIEVSKWTDGTSKLPGGYQENEDILYRITVVNLTDGTLTDITVTDPLYSGGTVGTIPALGPHASDTVGFDYTVTHQDVEDGIVTNQAEVTYKDPTGALHGPVKSNELERKTLKTIEPGKVTAWKDVKGAPLYAPFYLEGEPVHFQLHVHNGTDQPITDVKLCDALSPKADKVVATYPSIEPGGDRTADFDYPVTHWDAAVAGCVTNYGNVQYKGADGGPLIVMFGPVTVPAGVIESNDVPQADLVKKVTSTPKNKKFYQEGETIQYEITVTNTGAVPFPEVVILDSLKTDGGGELGRTYNVLPSESRVFYFSYKVTGADVDHHKVVNVATGTAWLPGHQLSLPLDSGPVTSPTGKEQDHTPGSDPGPKDPGTPEATLAPAPDEPAPSDDFCVRTLTGVGEGADRYTLDYCGEHKPVADAVAALAAAANTDAARLEAWQLAVRLWTDALNAEYDELLAGASPVEKSIILEEKALFYAQLACRQDALALANPEDPAAVAMRVSEQLMNRTADLCYKAHTAPGTRVDSRMGSHDAIEAPEPPADCEREVTATATGAAYLENLCPAHRGTASAADAALDEAADTAAIAGAWESAKQLWLAELDALTNARYLAADAADREVIAAERVAYGKWLKARENFLALMYPDQAGTVREVIAQTIRERVMDLCTEAE